MPAPRKRLAPRSIGQRFAAAIGLVAGTVLIVMAIADFRTGRNLLLDQTSREALRQVHDEVGNWDDLIERIGMLPMAIAATHAAGGDGVTVPWLASLLEQCPIPAVYGLYIALEGKDWKDPASDIWVDRKSWPKGARLKYDFHDPKQDWYAGAKATKGLHVTQPYFDEGGSDIDMMSITLAMRDASGKFLGVSGVDVDLEAMSHVVREMHLRDFGNVWFGSKKRKIAASLSERAYLISPSGAVVIGPEDGRRERLPLPGEENADRILGGLAAHGLPINSAHLQEVLKRPSGSLRLTEAGDTMVYWAESSKTGWKLLLEVPYSLIVTPARLLAQQSALIGGAGLLLLILAVFLTARAVAAPIRELQEVAEDLGQGDSEGLGTLDRIARRHDELGRFAVTFTEMAEGIRQREERLSRWNEELEKTIAERTSDLAKANSMMAAELAEAAAYSRAVLPAKLTHPVATDWIFQPCDRLGGDSFGYRWIDPDHMALFLLDVCGHGVGAALLSVSVVNVLSTGSLPGTDLHDPAAVLSALNAAFPMERHNEMYFTAWYGVYDRRSSTITYACGGHPPAVLLSPEGEMTLLAAKGPVVGVFPAVAFASASAPVPEGSLLYLFSDGVYEVVKPDATMMTLEEFCGILKDQKPTPTGVLGEITSRQGHLAFADDVSLVEFRFGGKAS
jgi:serine phosphatase RsbU (regulator of sigma subunit)